jgi:Tol biopolymer transport system component
MAVATILVALLGLPPGAQATYPGRNARIAYETTIANGGVAVFDGISSIPASSQANCHGTPPDDGVICDIGRVSYSPDGRTIVAARQSGSGGQLMVVGANGQNVRVLTGQTSDDEEPAFLSGGQRIVFTGSSGHATRNLYTVGTDGTGLKQLTKTVASWAAPCANGTIAFVRRDGLYLMRGNGTGVRRLVRGEVSTPDCGPNSRRIIYALPDGQIATVSSRGGRVTRIRNAAGAYPIFSPDGTEFAYTTVVYSQDGGELVTNLVIARLSGKRLRHYEVGDGVATDAGALTWQPR